ncbi:MAG: hypothetical protein KatS3mg003_1262 [Candidatus Nitrosocaldaceae archaeon]|nr:MAG: hypothetical protein KatS3mg003_0705 [Candidatus Nitrosocaldaceae archaeon]GIU71783.1 MAG: hypothetical protein KatS3mg003_1262 [Candidatus Nitrosocaldaceae archaeon]
MYDIDNFNIDLDDFGICWNSGISGILDVDTKTKDKHNIPLVQSMIYRNNNIDASGTFSKLNLDNTNSSRDKIPEIPEFQLIEANNISINNRTIKIPTWLIPNYKADPNRAYCEICGETCYHRMDMPLEQWAREHANLFHKELDEEYKEIEISNTSSNARLYECNICGALYKEEKNYRNHLALLHKKELSKDALGIMLNNDNYNLSDDEHANCLMHKVIQVR